MGLIVDDGTSTSNKTQTSLSRNVWNLSIKETIIDLYITKGLSLQKVQDRMAEQHKFYARYVTVLRHTTNPYESPNN